MDKIVYLANRKHTNRSIKLASILDIIADRVDPTGRVIVGSINGYLVLNGEIQRLFWV